jgi:hypothetical protein
MTKYAISTFLDDGGFGAEDATTAEAFLDYESYLCKVVSLANDIEVLLQLAHSPQCKHLFAFKFKVTPLGEQASKAIGVPQAAKDWETVFEKALIFRNRDKFEGAEDYVICTKKVEEDAAYMAREAIKRDLIIHCEVKLLLHIFRIENELPDTPKAYTYIGVSELSCRGCSAFFEFFNRIHNTRFVTKGSHGKSYWPWQFPPACPESGTVLEYTYRFIAQEWVEQGWAFFAFYDKKPLFCLYKIRLRIQFKAALAPISRVNYYPDAKPCASE